jgi:hypothetical protein
MIDIIFPYVAIIFIAIFVAVMYSVALEVGKRAAEGQVEYVDQHYGIANEQMPDEGYVTLPLNIPCGRGYYEMKMFLLVKDSVIYIKILEPPTLSKVRLKISLEEAQRSIIYGGLGDSLAVGFPKYPGVTFMIPLKARNLIPKSLREGIDYAA